MTTASIDPKRRALGKGLDSLIPRVQALAAADTEGGKPRDLPLDQVDRNPFQTRSHLNEEQLAELAASITSNGVVQPVLVRPLPNGRFQLIAGERRWRASQLAGKATIPAFLRQVSDEQAMEITIVENLQRTDLNPMEQARVESGELSFGHARTLLAFEHAEEMEKAAQRIAKYSLSVRQTENYVTGLLHPEKSAKKDHKTEPAIDPNVREVQERLQRALGLKVTIEDRNGRGKVIIEYGRLEDFDALMERFAAE